MHLPSALYTTSKVFEGEVGYWDTIDASFMSQESTHESDGELVMHNHTPVFHSDGRVALLQYAYSV